MMEQSLVQTAETSTSASTQNRTGSSRAKLACEACRATKVRCLRGHGFSQACTRCLLQGLACTLPPVTKRRGRPTRTNTEGRDTSTTANGNGYTNPAMSNTATTNHAMPHTAQNTIPSSLSPPIAGPSHLSQPWNPTGLNDQPFNGLDMTVSQTYSEPHDPMTGDSHGDLGSVDDTGGTSGIEGNGNGKTNLDLSEYLDPADGTLQVNAPNLPFYHNHPRATARTERSADAESGAMKWDDPVTLMILSELEAHALVELFHDRLNYLVAVLDSKLHTLQYLRSTSTVLFCAVLAAASKMSRADLHAQLLSHAQTLLDRAITAGAANVGVVQAIMILVYWKKPADTSAWRKIGTALRIGYQLYWHIPRKQPLPEDEMAARRILNIERTWFCLFSFDRGLSQTYGLPVTIRPNHMADPESWARSHLHLGPSVDMHVAFSIELCKLKDQWAAICEPRVPSSAYYDAVLDNIRSQCESLLAKWFTKEAPQPGFDLSKEHIGLWCTLDFLLIIKRHHLENAPYDQSRIDDCLADATRVADQIDILAENGELELMQDTESCMTSALVVLLRNIFHLTTIASKSLVIMLLQRILHAHTRASNGETNVATAYVARFVRRTLRAIGTESRAGSPARGQVVGGDMMEGQPEFLIQLQEFMRMPEDTLGANDDEYWSTLFST